MADWRSRERNRRAARAVRGYEIGRYAARRRREQEAARRWVRQGEQLDRERELAHGYRRRLLWLPTLWRRCSQRWPELRVYTQTSEVAWARMVFADRGSARAWQVVGNPIDDLSAVQMGLAAVVDTLVLLEANA